MTASDLLWILQALLGAFGLVLWANFRDVKKSNEITAKEFSDYKLHVAEKYVTSISLEKSLETVIESIKGLFTKLEKIEDKLYSKHNKEDN